MLLGDLIMAELFEFNKALKAIQAGQVIGQ